MPFYDPIESISMRWKISEDETAIAEVEIKCLPTENPTSFHIFTLGFDDELDSDSIVGNLGDRGALTFEKQSMETPQDSTVTVPDFIDGVLRRPSSYTRGNYAKASHYVVNGEILDSGFSEDASLVSPSIKKTANLGVSTYHADKLELGTESSCMKSEFSNSYQCDRMLLRDKQYLDIYCSEHGVKELVGKLELVNFRFGLRLYLHTFRLVRHEELNIFFTLYQRQVCNVTSTHFSKPLEPTYWRTSTVYGIPPIKGHIELCFTPDQLAYNLIADSSATFATHKVADGGAVSLLISASDLGQVPLERTIEVQLSRAVAVKEVSVTAMNCYTAVRFRDNGNSINVNYSLEFDAESDSELCMGDEVVLTSIYIAGGPEMTVELRQDSKFVDNCPVCYSAGSNRAAVKIESNNDGKNSFAHLQISFDQRYSKDAHAFWVPCVLNAAEGEAVVALLGATNVGIAGDEWKSIEQTCEYVGPTTSEMVLYREGQFPRSRASIRDISYAFYYAFENAYSSKVHVKVCVVLDIREVTVGEALIVMNTTEFWREPVEVLIEGASVSAGEIMSRNGLVAVLLRMVSNKRDIVVEFSWSQICLNRSVYLFNEGLPYIEGENENIKFKIDGVDFEEGSLSSGEMQFRVPRCTATTRFASEGEIWLQLKSKSSIAELESAKAEGPVNCTNLFIWTVVICLFGSVIWLVYPLSSSSRIIWAAQTNDLEIELEKTLEILRKTSEKAEQIQRQLNLKFLK